MFFLDFAKKHKIITTLLLTPILLCTVCLMLVSCASQDIKYNEAIAIAKQDFGCEKILWIQSGALILETKPEEEIPVYSLRSHYAYYIVGEKEGKEVYIVVPSNPDLDKPYTATWGLDYSFTQIVEKFNENEAQYVADVPDDYYSVNRDSYINLIVNRDTIRDFAEYYNVNDNYDSFYECLDVKLVFEYRWEVEGNEHRCMVAQENGELKAYKKVEVIYTPIG